MTDEEPNPQKLRSIKLDLEKRYLQFESTDATAIRLSLTPEGIRWELLQPPTITTARAVDRLVDAAEEEAPSEGKEKEPIQTLTGKLKGIVKEGRPDRQGKKTAYAPMAVHQDGEDKAKMVLASFYRHTANKALTLPADSQISASGYLRPTETPGRMDTFHIFNLVNYPDIKSTEDHN